MYLFQLIYSYKLSISINKIIIKFNFDINKYNINNWNHVQAKASFEKKCIGKKYSSIKQNKINK